MFPAGCDTRFTLAAVRYPCPLQRRKDHPMAIEDNERPLEAGIHTDLEGRMTYGG